MCCHTFDLQAKYLATRNLSKLEVRMWLNVQENDFQFCSINTKFRCCLFSVTLDKISTAFLERDITNQDNR